MSTPDKELCARMLKFGSEAYARGKYLDAKEYFKKAVKADPASLKAWRYYDQAVIFGLAENRTLFRRNRISCRHCLRMDYNKEAYMRIGGLLLCGLAF